MRQGRGQDLVLLAGLIFLLLIFLILDLRLGSMDISLRGMFLHITGEKALSREEVLILSRFRLPRLATALLAGAALPLGGLLMQTLFRNPLAGPYVLGISSGAGFGAALVVLGAATGMLISPWKLVMSSWLGAGAVMLILLIVSFRVRESVTLLILGMMFSSALSAIISIMQYFSRAAALKSFVIWSMGSLGHVTGVQLMIMSFTILPLLMLSLGFSRSLNGLLLGEEYARTMGINILRVRTLLLIITSILAGTVTAFCGPIGFIGIAVPHISRFLCGSSDHRILIPVTMVSGMLILVISDLISQLPGSEQVLPINAVTSLIGIPVVIWLLLSRRKLHFS